MIFGNFGGLSNVVACGTIKLFWLPMPNGHQSWWVKISATIFVPDCFCVYFIVNWIHSLQCDICCVRKRNRWLTITCTLELYSWLCHLLKSMPNCSTCDYKSIAMPPDAVFDSKCFQGLPFWLYLNLKIYSPIKVCLGHIFLWYGNTWEVLIALWASRF